MRKGFSLAEILLALGLLVIAILSVAALSFLTLASNRKASDTQTGQLVAAQVLERTIYDAGSTPTAAFWTFNSAASVYETQTVNVGTTPFNTRLYVTDLNITDDPDIPGKTIRLKRVEVIVNWWDSHVSDRQGYGKLEARAYRTIYGP